MGRNAHDLNPNLVALYSIDHAVLLVQSGGPVATPLATERLFIEAANHPQAGWTRYRHDVLPFFVALKDLQRELFQLTRSASVFKYLPHEAILYTLFGMSISQGNSHRSQPASAEPNTTIIKPHQYGVFAAAGRGVVASP